MLDYFVFNLFILDYFGLFRFGFRLSVQLDLTSKSGDQKLLKTCIDKYSEGQFWHIRYYKLDFF